MSDITSTRIIQALALGSASYLSGFITTFSVAIPAMSVVPIPLAAKQWYILYNRGKGRAPYIALCSTACFAALSYLSGGVSTTEGVAYAAAGASVIAIVPYTFTAMAKTNGALTAFANRPEPVGEGERIKEMRETREKEDVEKLLVKWTWLNYARAVGPLVGAVLGFWTVFGA